MASPFRRAALLSAVAIGLPSLILPGCSGEAVLTRKAKSTYREKMSGDANYADYGVSLAAGSETPFARELLGELLVSEDQGHVRRALAAVVDSPPAGAREALSAIFEEKQGLMKLNAGIALARLDDAAAFEWVRSQVLEDGGTLTPTAVALMAERGEAENLKGLLAARIESDRLSIRNEAYGLLGEIGEPWATELLRQGLDKEFGAEREGAIVALGRAGAPEAASKIERLINYQGLVFASIEALGALGNPDSLDAVRKMAAHEAPLVRAYAGVALWRLGDESGAAEVLEPLLADQAPEVRLNLAQQLASVDSDGANGLLTQLASDADRNVRVAALQALSARPPAGALDLFLEASAESDYEIATLALNGLARIGGAEALARLEPLLASENPYIAISAAHAVLAIEGRSAGGA